MVGFFSIFASEIPQPASNSESEPVPVKSGAVWARVRTVILKNTGVSPEMSSNAKPHLELLDFNWLGVDGILYGFIALLAVLICLIFIYRDPVQRELNGLRASLLEGFNVCRPRLSCWQLPGAVKRLTVVERRKLRRELALQNKLMRKIQHLEQRVQAMEELVMNYTQKKCQPLHSRRAGSLASLGQCPDCMVEAGCSSPGFSSGDEDEMESRQSFSA
ncbi:uncharacterized protein LOC121308238 [Polyodon spathula]|uniref:uncharacterized protein LOC121308238 n=1 Tax=Polyodon spathula TaxID=7913 RepID=UPI001B7DC99D|nr:uncharacterized protein LOC121308238 [Polyodon spathula]